MNDLQRLTDFENACILAGRNMGADGHAFWARKREIRMALEGRLKELAARADAWEALSGEAHQLRLENAHLREDFQKALGDEYAAQGQELAEAHNVIKVLLAACELALPEVRLKEQVACNVDDAVSPDIRRLWRVALALEESIKIGRDACGS